MAQCTRYVRCTFFNTIEALPKTAQQLMDRYCLGDNSDCARFKCAASGISPPDDLYPNEMDRAVDIIQKSGTPFST